MHIEIRDNTFHLLAQRAVYWEQEKALICSDLHWGREILLQKFGMAIPEHSFQKETEFLEQLFAQMGAKEWWILGDLIHHPLGLVPEFKQRMGLWMKEQLQSGLDRIRFVPGNHDRNIQAWANELPIQFEHQGIQKGAFRFLHEPDSIPEQTNEGIFSWYGHIHPAITPPMVGQRKLPCFWIQKNQGFLPAFSRLAGGFEITPLEKDLVYVIADQQVIRLY